MDVIFKALNDPACSALSDTLRRKCRQTRTEPGTLTCLMNFNYSVLRHTPDV
jgi:hypothetical protein